MSLHRRNPLGTLGLVILFAACRNSNEPVTERQQDLDTRSPSFTAASGTTSTLLGRALFTDSAETFKVKRITGDWHAEIKAKPAFDLAVQSIAFPAGSHSGWHSHPGPVFIQVVEGTMTFYESHDPTCTGVIRTKGQGFLDMGEHAHIARNESGAPALNIVTYFAPPGADLRINEPKPGNCPF